MEYSTRHTTVSLTRKRPHSPHHHHKNPLGMMLETAKVYSSTWNLQGTNGRHLTLSPLHGLADCPSLLYLLFTTAICTTLECFFATPNPFPNGSFMASLLTGFGHWAGYRNVDTPDESRNTLPIDLFLMGALP